MKNFIAVFVLFPIVPLTASAQGEKLDKAWLDEVAALKPAEQAKAIGAKLRQLNIQFAGGVNFKAEDDRIVEFSFLGNGVKEIAPLVVLKHVKKLNFSGTPPSSEADRERVRDIAVLKGMPLVELYMRWCVVKDLTPLKGMAL